MQQRRRTLDHTTYAGACSAPGARSHSDLALPEPLVDDEASSMHRCAKDVRYRSIRPGVEVGVTWVGIAVTVLAALFVCGHAAGAMHRAFAAGAYLSLALESVLLGVILFLIYGSFVHQFSRKGYFARLRRHQPPRLTDVWERLENSAPPATILVPSYKEEARVVRAALLSAALQHYPNRHVVLLIDDPPFPTTDDDRHKLAEARALPGRIMELLAPARRRFAAALADAESRLSGRPVRGRREAATLALLYEDAASWFDHQAKEYPVADRADALFVQSTFRDRARYLRTRANACKQRARSDGGLPNASLLRGYREVASVFDVEVTSFERKRYENLPHAPNKAMNLNSYIAVAGTRVREVRRDGKLLLDADPHGENIPDPRYFVTLDADSLLAPDYVLRLIDVMEDPRAERIGVIQTPYSAFPSSSGLLEHVAGATTDIQHIIHQGFTAHDATYWVGANAVLRTAALRDIAVVAEERGFPVICYIQERTVIEDTESSIDLLLRDWTLVNFPERLSYSATPPDFGSLVIQRRRWVNGGLLIVPKLVSHVFRQLRDSTRAKGRLALETFLRLHYLVSLAAANIGLLLVLSLPSPDGFITMWLPLSAAPYYLLYGRDLLQAGYGLRDPFRVYALNLLLVPVHIGGVFKSIEQMWTGKQIPFHRTPKVLDRTAPPLRYALAELALLLVMVAGGLVHLVQGRWLNAAFAFLNGGFLLYGIVVLMGLSDIRLAVRASETLRTLRRRSPDGAVDADAA